MDNWASKKKRKVENFMENQQEYVKTEGETWQDYVDRLIAKTENFDQFETTLTLVAAKIRSLPEVKTTYDMVIACRGKEWPEEVKYCVRYQTMSCIGSFNHQDGSSGRQYLRLHVVWKISFLFFIKIS